MGALDNLVKSKNITPQKTSALDNLLSPKKEVTPVGQIKKPVKLSESIGGGEFTQPGFELATTTRGYPMSGVQDQWREHIIPVALGGTSSGDNVKLYGKQQGEEKTKFENEQIRLYKQGKVSLQEARANILSKYRQLIGTEPTVEETKQIGGTGKIGSAIDKLYSFFTKKKDSGFRPFTESEKLQEQQLKQSLSEPIKKTGELTTKPAVDFVAAIASKPQTASQILRGNVFTSLLTSLREEPKNISYIPKTETGKLLLGEEVKGLGQSEIINQLSQAIESRTDIPSSITSRLAQAGALPILGLFADPGVSSFGKKVTKNILEKGLQELGEKEMSRLMKKGGIEEIEKALKMQTPKVSEAVEKIIDENIVEPQDFLAWQKAEADKIRAESVPFYNDFETENNFQTFKNLLSDKRFSNPKVKEALLSKDAQSFKAELEKRGVMTKVEADNLLYSQEKGDNSVFDEFVARIRDENPALLSSKKIATELGQIKVVPKLTKIQTKVKQPSVQATEPLKSTAQELTATQRQALLRLETEQPTAQQLPGIGHILQKETSYKNLVNKLPTTIEEKVTLLDYLRTPDRVLNKIGLGNEMKLLRTQYEKYISELLVEISRITEWAKRVGKDDNIKIFKYLDGQDVKIDGETLKVANEIKAYLSDWADKLKLPKENRITNYITHIFDDSLIKKEFPEELARIISNKMPGSVYDPFTLQRLGALGYVEDTWRALDAYVKRGVRKYNIDPALEKIKLSSKKLEKSQYDYVKSYINKINMRPSDVDNLLDNLLKQVPFIGYKLGQRPTAKLSRIGRQQVYRGALGLNISSALRNLSQGANTYAKLGERYTAQGYIDMIKNWNSAELEKAGILLDNIAGDRQLSSIKSIMEKADKGLFYLFETVEKINRGAAYYGAKAKALKDGKTLDEAIEAGKKMVRDTQFTFGSIDTPVALQNDIVKLFSQFQTFTVKQTEFLGEMLAKKELAGLARYIGASLLFIYTIGQAFGMKPKDMVPSFRFGSPPALAPVTKTAGAILDTPNKYGQQRDVTEKTRDVLATGIPFIPAGVQAKKTLQGLGVYAKGKKTDKIGKTMFKIKKNIPNLIRSAAFGQYATPEAKKYLNK